MNTPTFIRGTKWDKYFVILLKHLEGKKKHLVNNTKWYDRGQQPDVSDKVPQCLPFNLF